MIFGEEKCGSQNIDQKLKNRNKDLRENAENLSGSVRSSIRMNRKKKKKRGMEE